LEFFLAIPGANAALGRVFSIENALLTEESNRYLVETIKAVIAIKVNIPDNSRIVFYTPDSNSLKLLN
jgi:hypothetical protein